MIMGILFWARLMTIVGTRLRKLNEAIFSPSQESGSAGSGSTTPTGALPAPVIPGTVPEDCIPGLPDTDTVLKGLAHCMQKMIPSKGFESGSFASLGGDAKERILKILCVMQQASKLKVLEIF